MGLYAKKSDRMQFGSSYECRSVWVGLMGMGHHSDRVLINHPRVPIPWMVYCNGGKQGVIKSLNWSLGERIIPALTLGYM